MKARDAERVATLRMALSAMNYRRIERSGSLTDAEMLDVLRKQVRQRDDSIQAYRDASRADLADKEARERAILQAYLPAEMSGDELRAAVDELLKQVAAHAKMGDAMKLVVPALKDRASSKAIADAVKAALQARAAT